MVDCGHPVVDCRPLNNVLYLLLLGAVSTFTNLTSSSELSLRKLPA